MIHHLYLYLDNFSFSDYFSTNAIACENFLPNKKGSRTLSRNTQNFLFVTHKRIDEASRHNGISDQLTSWPVTLELSIDTERYAKFPVVFVKESSDGTTLALGDIKDYSEDEHIGCFVMAEIPFSTVSKIMFENEEQLNDSDKSIFPDFMWKDSIVGVIPKNEFVESISVSVNERELFETVSVEEASVECLGLFGNKYKAAVLQFVNGTKEWETGKYKTSFDPAVLNYFGISKDDVLQILSRKEMPTPASIFETISEPLSLIPTDLSVSGDLIEQDIYNTIVKALLVNKEKVSPAVVKNILATIKEAIASISNESTDMKYAKSLDEIEGCVLNAVGYNVDETLKKIVDRHGANSPLIALFFTMKNPAEFEKFVLSLRLYKVDSVSARRAMVLWGFLNGTKGIPAANYNRDNSILWESIEWKYGVFYANDLLAKMEKPIYIEDSPCGIEIFSEEIVTFEEVQAFFAVPGNLKKGIVNEIYTVAKSLDRDLSKKDPYSRYNVSALLEEIRKISEETDPLVNITTLKGIEKKLKNCTSMVSVSKKNPEIDYKQFHMDWISNPVKFKKVWDVLEPKLKAFYFKWRGQK